MLKSKGAKVFIISLNPSIPSKHSNGARIKKTVRVDLVLPSKKYHHNFVSAQAMSQRPCKGLAISSPNPKQSPAIPDVKFFPPAPASCMHPQIIFCVHQNKKSQLIQPLCQEAPVRIEEKQKVVHSIPFCACQLPP
jgi:hypothetical protein